MNKKKLIFAIILTAAFILAVSRFFTANNGLKTTPIQMPTLVPAYPTTINTPKRLNISGVNTNDFTLNPIKSNIEGDLLFSQTNDYQIVYSRQYKDFTIDIFSSSQDTRIAAESDFLNRLGISKDNACKLTVYVEQEYSPDLPISSNKRLSFCP